MEYIWSMTTVHPNLAVSQEALADFCRKWGIRELALFGSAVRDDFRPDSDIDVMVEFDAEAKVGLLGLARLRHELAEMLERDVDVVEKGTIRNPYRRAAIARDLRVVYAA